ncbi:hypothetical protein BDP27DRAFT_1376251 [Rhodocollybia butyracea]|uniref:Myb/SANT-like domain-containing protein n=1 Tax=Rhodocollybia butyracea TaxID=206335 RepID=A0A9P5P578_9AGAR|nr:hypothetical protein BDP27DRAFT_1376251 [Rhodocollybia butyracea]
MSQPASDQQNEIATSENTGGKKASWELEHDRVLIEVLKEQKAGGFQTDNGGFHGDAYKAAAAKLVTATSKGGAKTSESCKTRWAILKKDFKDVKTIRNKSANVWDDLIKAKPKLKKWRRKAFPLYDEILDIIEGQIATGAMAFFPGDPANNPSPGLDKSDESGEEEEEEEDSQLVLRLLLPLLLDHLSCPVQAPTHPRFHSRKRCPATPDDRPWKRAHGRKPTQSDAGFEMAEAVRDLARSAMGDYGNSSALSPARKTRAIALIEKDNQLSENEMIDAFKLIRRDTSVADTYLAIGDIYRRTNFLQSELSPEL